MTESTQKILELVYQRKNINEITEELNISRKKLYSVLRQVQMQGYDINRRYYYNGDIAYHPRRTFQTYKGVNIITSKDVNTFEALVISDLHLGCEKERLDKIKQAYDYCAKEGINIIIICGDFIDGMYGPYKKFHTNIKEQIDYAIEKYPFDKNILNFITFGDHDFNALDKYGINIATILENYRHDIVSLGYGLGQLNIKNDYIFVGHPSPIFDSVKITPDKLNKHLILYGHSHQMKLNYSRHNYKIYIPTLSDLPGNGIQRPPQAIRMSLNFTNRLITYASFKHLIFDKFIYEIGEHYCDLGRGKDLSTDIPSEIEEDMIKKKTLTL